MVSPPLDGKLFLEAAFEKKLDVVKAALAAGVDVDAQEADWGRTAMHYAAMRGQSLPAGPMHQTTPHFPWSFGCASAKSVRMSIANASPFTISPSITTRVALATRGQISSDREPGISNSASENRGAHLFATFTRGQSSPAARSFASRGAGTDAFMFGSRCAPSRSIA